MDLELHHLQKELVRKLSFGNNMHFNDLIIEGLESEHMNYHLKKLVDQRFVVKQESIYVLTDKGKDYSNMLDDEMKTIEKQPKSSIIIRGVKEENGVFLHLVSRRLKHPYYGKVGRLTGKVRFGETLQEAAERELFEETGLIAESYQLEEVYHKLRHREDGTFVQDVIFYIFLVTGFKGTLVEKTQYQENFWISKEDVFRLEDVDPYDDLVLEDRITPMPLTFTEHCTVAEGF